MLYPQVYAQAGWLFWLPHTRQGASGHSSRYRLWRTPLATCPTLLCMSLPPSRAASQPRLRIMMQDWRGSVHEVLERS